MQSVGWHTLDGLRTRYLEAGKENQHALVFIHGLGSSADRWLDIPLALSLYYHTISIDLPGFGMSDKPESFSYGIEEYSRHVGHSLGGYIAAEIAIRNPSIADQLVLFDSSGMLQGPTELLQKYLACAMNPTRESVRQVFEQLVAHPSRIPDILVDGFIYRMSQPGAKHAFRQAYEKSVNTRIGEKRLEGLSAIRTLIIWGSQDKLIPPSYQSLFNNPIRGSVAIQIDDAGHAPFAEKPALACEIMHQFLAE
jgi:pimeloyl-ACP methyl ester carboxylesterase